MANIIGASQPKKFKATDGSLNQYSPSQVADKNIAGADPDIANLYNAGVFNSEPTLSDINSGFQSPNFSTTPKLDTPSYTGELSAKELQDARSGILSQFQDQINSTKSAYGQLLAQTKLQSQGRLGEDTAIQARRGLAGSDFGGAQTEKVRSLNMSEEQKVLAAQAAALAGIDSTVAQLTQDEINNRRNAKIRGGVATREYFANLETTKKANLEALATAFLTQGYNPLEMDKTKLEQYAKSLGTTTSDIINSYLGGKAVKEQADAEAEAQMVKDNSFNLSEGQARYQYNPETGQVEQVASRGKTYAPSSSGGSSTGSATGVSKQAQDIIDIMNIQGGSIDDYVKGTSNAAQKLRSEVFAGIAAQGGNTEKNRSLLTEAKAVIDDMIAESDWKKFGYSAVLGGRLTTGYGDMKMRADQVSAILARDNLGLLKGAMSDKDLAFIQAMSGGINDGTISEEYAKQRMESIQEKIQNKLGEVQETGGNITVGDDGQEYEIVD